MNDYFATLPGHGLTANDFHRDSVHANLKGKQIFGRILLRWFQPEGG